MPEIDHRWPVNPAASAGVMRNVLLLRGHEGPDLTGLNTLSGNVADHGRLIAEQHAEAMGSGEIDMVELEFPDCPEAISEGGRFFRIGPNPAGMVLPIQVKL